MAAGIWDPATGSTERDLHGHTGEVRAVCPIRVDGRALLASASSDRTVRIWDPATGSVEHVLDGHTGIVRVVCPIRVDGRALLASASTDRTVRIWDPATGMPVSLIPVPRPAGAINGVKDAHIGRRHGGRPACAAPDL